MSKIVIDARESGTSTGRYIDKLIEYLHKLRPRHEIIVLTKAPRLEFIANIAPSFGVIQTDFKEFTFGEQLGFLRQIRDLKPDLVHFGKDHQPILYRGTVVTTMHDLTTARFHNPDKNPLLFTVKQLVYRFLVVQRAARKSNAIIAISQHTKDDVVKYTHTNPSKITVIYEAADFITDPPVPVGGLAEKRFIMYVGRPTPHKNLGRLISAFAQLQRDHPDLCLVLAGKKDTNYDRHAATVQQQGIDNVIFTDFITDAQLRWLYEHCAAYVFPSLSEGFGLPGLEAMVHGAPVVSSNATCLPEVYGDAAHYFDPLSVQDMAAKIGEVLDDPILREDLVEKGKAQAATYSWQRMAEQTLAVYEQVLSKR